DLQEIERDALRRLRTDTRQATELVDQRLHDAFVDVHGLSVPPSPPRIEPRSIPPVTAPSFCDCSSLAWRVASLTAATTRTSSVSTSSRSTTLGSIVMLASISWAACM